MHLHRSIFADTLIFIMSIGRRSLLNSGVPCFVLVLCIFFSYFPGSIFSSTEITLSSIKLFTTHEWLKFRPEVYFQCKGENKTELPDVKKAHILYTFNGEESWQPLTELSSQKCKRCGFYEYDTLKSDVFHEWEFCSSDFTADGKYYLFQEKEFNATFLCSECNPSARVSKSGPDEDGHANGKQMHTGLVILISIVASTIMILGMVGAFKYWEKKKREQDQARFLKLFEEEDDIEDELGLGNVIT